MTQERVPSDKRRARRERRELRNHDDLSSVHECEEVAIHVVRDLVFERLHNFELSVQIVDKKFFVPRIVGCNRDLDFGLYCVEHRNGTVEFLPEEVETELVLSAIVEFVRGANVDRDVGILGFERVYESNPLRGLLERLLRPLVLTYVDLDGIRATVRLVFDRDVLARDEDRILAVLASSALSPIVHPFHAVFHTVRLHVNELLDTIPETVQTTVEVHGGRHFLPTVEIRFLSKIPRESLEKTNFCRMKREWTPPCKRCSSISKS
jgi:hypothetical protein